MPAAKYSARKDAKTQRKTAKKNSLPVAKLLVIAVWFGLAAGLGEALILSTERYVLNRVISFGLDVVWMAPLADLLLFSIVGLLLALISLRWSRITSSKSVVLIFTFLACWGWLLMFAWLHRFAALLLAFGVAFQAARVFGPLLDRLVPAMKRSLPAMAALLILLAGGIQGWQHITERDALAELPPAAPGAPNVILLVLDTVGAEAVSTYGYARETTPNLDRFAATGVQFERALSTAPWTLASHASMFTGHYPHELSVDWDKPLDETFPTLAEALRARGYVTGGFVANYYCSFEFGLNRGFTHYEDFAVSGEELAVSSSLVRTATNNARLRALVGDHQMLTRKNASELNRNLLSWLSRRGDRPFFAFVNYLDAHEPYMPPRPFDLKFGPRNPPKGNLVRHELRLSWRRDRDRMTPREAQSERDAYDDSIAYLDHEVGLLLDTLQTRGLLDNTMIIITGDHGEAFGEHGYFTHGDNLYLNQLHVPLLIRFPKHDAAGTRINEPVSLRDLPATVLGAVAPGERAWLPGTSVSRFWKQTEAPGRLPKAYLLSEVNLAPIMGHRTNGSKAVMQSLVVNRYHYIRNIDGREELYDFVSDPPEDRNLAPSFEGRDAIDIFIFFRIRVRIRPAKRQSEINNQ